MNFTKLTARGRTWPYICLIAGADILFRPMAASDRRAGLIRIFRMTRVRRITESSELAALREDWNRLCGSVPFCHFDWNNTWWRHYHQDGELYALEVRDDADQVVGIAPWYLKRNTAQGRVLAFMASGEVCSDYQTVLCEPGCETLVAGALADWLSDVRNSLTEWVTREDRDRWDLIEWESVPLADHMLKELAEQLKQRGAAVYQRPSDTYWRIP